MAGVSQYKRRSQLLREKATGITPEIDPATQRRFDLGHEYEDIARPWAEEIIGSELFPVVLADEIDGMPLSASLDGLTMMEDICWEHKTGNVGLLASLEAGVIPIEYHYQMEQCLMLSGAHRCLFMASSGDKDAMRYVWYEPRPEIRAQLLSGWGQFAKDLAAYSPKEIAEKPKTEAILSLPALAIQIRGEVTLSNLPAFKEAATKFIANINTDLKTDEDFAQAEATVKFCKSAEDDLDAAKKSAIGQTASIDELMRTIDHIQAQLRDKRLVLDKAVKNQKQRIKEEIVKEASDEYTKHCIQLDDELRGLGLTFIGARPDFDAATKNKKTLASLHGAVDDTLADAKITADAQAKALREKAKWFKENGGSTHMFLFSDFQQLAQKEREDFMLAVLTRIDSHKKAEAEKQEADRQRIQQEEQKKAEAKVRAEQESAEEAAIVEAMAKSEKKEGRDIVAVAVLDPAAKRAAVIEHQDDISTFLKARTFKDESRIRAILVEFVKHQAERALDNAA